MEMTMRNEKKYSFVLDSKIAEAVAEHHQDGGVFFSIEGKNAFSVDFKSVMAIRVFPTSIRTVPGPTSQPYVSPPPYIHPPVPQPPERKHEFPAAAPAGLDDQDKPKELYKIECKCGATYFAKMFADTERCKCRECGERVYVDKFAPKGTGDNNQVATLATNRYRVAFADTATTVEIEQP
jgi:hypothetical protein